MTQDERRIAAHLLEQIGRGLRPDAEAAKAAHVLLMDLVTHVHGASSHTPRRKRLRPTTTPAADNGEQEG